MKSGLHDRSKDAEAKQVFDRFITTIGLQFFRKSLQKRCQRLSVDEQEEFDVASTNESPPRCQKGVRESPDYEMTSTENCHWRNGMALKEVCH